MLFVIFPEILSNISPTPLWLHPLFKPATFSHCGFLLNDHVSNHACDLHNRALLIGISPSTGPSKSIEQIGKKSNFGPHERASHCHLRHCTVCWRELNVSMHNSDGNVYQNTTSCSLITEPRRQQTSWKVAFSLRRSKPILIPAFGIFFPCQQEIEDEGGKKSRLVANKIHKSPTIPFTNY